MVVDFAPHDLEFLRDTHAHRRLGFAHEQMNRWLEDFDLEILDVTDLAPPPDKTSKLTVSLWLARDKRIITDLPVCNKTQEVA